MSKGESRASSKRRSRKPKSPVRNRRIVHWLLLFVGSVIIVDGLVGDRGLVAMMHAQRQYEELSATLARQRAENTRLREEARRLSEDPAAIEEIARRELGLIKPGERLFIINDVLPAKQ